MTADQVRRVWRGHRWIVAWMVYMAVVSTLALILLAVRL